MPTRRRHDAEVAEAPSGPSAGTRTARGSAGTPARRSRSRASGEPKRSTCTEWSITRSTGTSGLIRLGSPPSRCMALRIAARSTTAGTPVKSWSTTRAGLKGISDRRRPRRPSRPARFCHVVLGHLRSRRSSAAPTPAARGSKTAVPSPGQTGVFQPREAVDPRRAGAGVKRVAGVKRIVDGHAPSSPPRSAARGFATVGFAIAACGFASVYRYSRTPSIFSRKVNLDCAPDAAANRRMA